MKQQHGLRGLNPVLKEVLLWVKCCQRALCATEKFRLKESLNTSNFIIALLVLEIAMVPHQLSATTSLIIQQPSTLRQDLPPAK